MKIYSRLKSKLSNFLTQSSENISLTVLIPPSQWMPFLFPQTSKILISEYPPAYWGKRHWYVTRQSKGLPDAWIWTYNMEKPVQQVQQRKSKLGQWRIQTFLGRPIHTSNLWRRHENLICASRCSKNALPGPVCS